MATWGSKKNYGLPDSVLDAVREVVSEKKLDPVNKQAVKKDFDDRKDQDIDNDGDVDSSDEYLHKRRKAVSKAMQSEKKNGKGMTKNPDPVEVDPKLKEEAKVKCPRCGTMNDPSNDKCTNCGLPLSEFDSFQKEGVELDEAMRVLAKKGKTQVVTKGDGVARVMVGGKEVASGDLDDGAGGFFMSRKGEKGQKFFDSAQKIADFYAEEATTEGLEDNTSNPANSQHLCAKQVVHEEWGTGNPIYGMHAEPDADGQIAWYDVMFNHGIERQVSIDEMKVIKSAMHGNHKKKK